MEDSHRPGKRYCRNSGVALEPSPASAFRPRSQSLCLERLCKTKSLHVAKSIVSLNFLCKILTISSWRSLANWKDKSMTSGGVSPKLSLSSPTVALGFSAASVSHHLPLFLPAFWTWASSFDRTAAASSPSVVFLFVVSIYFSVKLLLLPSFWKHPVASLPTLSSR